MPARDLRCLNNEIVAAKRRFGLQDEAPVMSCYEAGRDGFWLHRALTGTGVTSLVVDSASIERNARARQVKSDRLDTEALLNKLCRHAAGERGVWSVINVLGPEDEDRRLLHRELFTVRREHARVINRIKGLLALYGIGFGGRGLPRVMPLQGELQANHIVASEASNTRSIVIEASTSVGRQESRGCQQIGQRSCVRYDEPSPVQRVSRVEVAELAYLCAFLR